MTLDEVVAQLYRADPGDFVRTRDARAKAAEQQGDRELARAIGKLRKPTTAAWTVNLLAQHAAEEIDALLRLGTDLRAAQRQLSGGQLRELTDQRRRVVEALAERAGALTVDGRSVPRCCRRCARR